MFKFITRNAVRYAIFKTWQGPIIRILICFVILVCNQFIYQDLSDNFKSTQALKCHVMDNEFAKISCTQRMEIYRQYALVGKWAINLSAVLVIIFTLNPIRRRSSGKEAVQSSNNSNQSANSQTTAISKVTSNTNASTDQRSEKLNNIASKPKLKSEADLIWERFENKD